MKTRVSLLAAILVASMAKAQIPCIANTNSLTFNGSSAFVQMPSSPVLNITDSLTVEAWVNPLSFATNPFQNSIVCKHGSSANKSGYVLRCGGTGQLSFAIAGDTVNGSTTNWAEVISPANALPLNTWSHVAGTFDGTVLKIYVNGNMVASKAYTGSINESTPYNMRIGRWSDPGQTPSRFFDGKIDEVRVWHRLISQAEIMANKSHHIDTAYAPGLVGYWQFNDGTGSVINDYSGNNITAADSGATWTTVVPFNNVPFAPVVTLISFATLHSNAANNIQWNLNGQPIPNATQQNYVYSQNGNYTVTVTNASGCSATSLPYTVVNAGIKDYSFDKSVTVSPNPASDFINVSFKDAVYNKLQLTDVTGRIVLEKTLDQNRDQIVHIDITTFNKGVYFIKLSGTQKVITKQLVIE